MRGCVPKRAESSPAAHLASARVQAPLDFAAAAKWEEDASVAAGVSRAPHPCVPAAVVDAAAADAAVDAAVDADVATVTQLF